LRYDPLRSCHSDPEEYELSVPEQLGPPSLHLKAFQFWVHGRQFPEAQDRWDGNWLNVTVHCGEAGASVWATGAILDTAQLESVLVAFPVRGIID
jgi:hypothetical protein